jgi:hypothetical protein
LQSPSGSRQPKQAGLWRFLVDPFAVDISVRRLAGVALSLQRMMVSTSGERNIQTSAAKNMSRMVRSLEKKAILFFY